jgi:hypothetical protein
VLDEAPTRRDVLDVELVDLRRDGYERAGPGRIGARRVLDQFEHLGSMHHLARGGGQVLADGEGPAVDRRRHPVVVARVLHEVPSSPHEAATAGLDRFAHRLRVSRQCVRRRHCLREEGDRESGPLPALGVERHVVNDTEHGPGLHQVRLHQPPVHRVGGPRRMGEAFVPGRGLHPAAPDHHFDELAGCLHSVGQHDTRLDGHAPE